MAMIKRLTSEGRSIVYVSHRLGEIKTIADRITVLRDGSLVGTYAGDSRLMFGHEVTLKNSKERITKKTEPYFWVENIGIPGIFKNVSFSVGKGEILGIAGLMGSGRTEVARALFGITPVSQGRMYINGVPVKIDSPNEAIKRGIALLPEDRQALGLFIKETIGFNTTFSVPRRITGKAGWINYKAEEALTNERCSQLQTKYTGPAQHIEELSGGNQQKIGLAKWIATDPDIQRQSNGHV